ncbi:hypothetical protein [Castellaniella sp.]
MKKRDERLFPPNVRTDATGNAFSLDGKKAPSRFMLASKKSYL